MVKIDKFALGQLNVIFALIAMILFIVANNIFGIILGVICLVISFLLLIFEKKIGK